MFIIILTCHWYDPGCTPFFVYLVVLFALFRICCIRSMSQLMTLTALHTLLIWLHCQSISPLLYPVMSLLMTLIILYTWIKFDYFVFVVSCPCLYCWPWLHSIHCLSIYLAFVVHCPSLSEDGVAQSVEHWTANLAARVRSPVGEEPSNLVHS